MYHCVSFIRLNFRFNPKLHFLNLYFESFRYFVLNTLLVLYSIIYEKEIIFVGYCEENDNKHTITIQTNAKRYSDIYNIIYEYTEERKQDSSTKVRNSKYTISKSFGSWFDVKGVMDVERFERDLFEGLEIVKTGNKPHEQ